LSYERKRTLSEMSGAWQLRFNFLKPQHVVTDCKTNT
jgi:hypothetical protein